MDAAVLIGNFPFLIIEGKSKDLSPETALQGFQHYGLRSRECHLIDNDPCFVATLASGLLNKYDVATVNSRVVCDCLVSLEISNYHSDINGFIKKFFRCITGLIYVHDQFVERINIIKRGNIANENFDHQHQKYYAHMKLETCDKLPLPAIFDIKEYGNESDKIISISSFELKILVLVMN